MEIKVNGESKALPDEPFSIEATLKRFDVEMPDMVSVQLNGAFVDRKEFGSTYLKAGDEIDFLYFMGGGAAV